MQKAVFYGSMATVLTQARQPTNLKITKKNNCFVTFSSTCYKSEIECSKLQFQFSFKKSVCNATTMRIIVKLENSQEVTYLK